MPCCNPSTLKASICCRNWTGRKMSWLSAESRYLSWIEDWPILLTRPLKATSLLWPTKTRIWWRIFRRLRMLPYRPLWLRRRRLRSSTRLSADTNLWTINSSFNTKSTRAWRGSWRLRWKRSRRRSTNLMKRLRDKEKTSLINWKLYRRKRTRRRVSRRVCSKKHKIYRET